MVARLVEDSLWFWKVSSQRCSFSFSLVITLEKRLGYSLLLVGHIPQQIWQTPAPRKRNQLVSCREGRLEYPVLHILSAIQIPDVSLLPVILLFLRFPALGVHRVTAILLTSNSICGRELIIEPDSPLFGISYSLTLTKNRQKNPKHLSHFIMEHKQ